MPNSISDPKARLREQARAEGFDVLRIASAEAPPQDKARLNAFLQSGYHGEMDWLAAHAERRAAPDLLWPQAKSILMLGVNYAPSSDPLAAALEPSRGAISVYARGEDYHDLIKKRLKRLARFAVARFGGDAKVFVDTAPILEKAVAMRAGIGWQGKHTNLVSRDFGSWLFLGSVFSTVEFPPDPPEHNHCGNCRACLDICPTDAFVAPYRMDARRCISYLTIEHKGPIPRRFREKIGNRIYGCDDCLAVCPWNKFARAANEIAFAPRPALDAMTLADFAALDDAGFRALFAKSPIKRIGRARFLRNVLIAIGNGKDAASMASVAPLLGDPSPLVRGAAAWAASRLCGEPAFRALAARSLQDETDPGVRAEYAEALAGRSQLPNIDK